MDDLYNESNIIEELKYKEKVKNTLINFVVFFVWVIGYVFILNVEHSKGDALAYFGLAFCFSLVSLVSIIFIPSHREESLKLFKFGLLGYALYTIMFEFILKLSSGGNVQMVLKNIGIYGRIMIPIGLIVWQGKEIFMFFKGKRSKNDEIENLKEHGNDGFH